jgi:hypothetical protein
MVAYWLPLQAGSTKAWGTPTEDFWCCHGTLVEAHTVHERSVYFEDGDGLVVSQYIPSRVSWEHRGTGVTLTQTNDPQLGVPGRPQSLAFSLAVSCDRPAEFSLKIRLPWWLQGEPEIRVNGEALRGPFAPSSLYGIQRTWGDDRISVVLPKALTSVPLPDKPDSIAFMDGPVVLAGICNEERTLYGDRNDPRTMLTPHNEREWGEWEPGYRTVGQEHAIRFVPLHRITDEPYTVYFPVQDA